MVFSIALCHLSYYWVFDTPIYPAWIASEEARDRLEKAARGQSESSEEIREQLRRDVQSGSAWRFRCRFGTV